MFVDREFRHSALRERATTRLHRYGIGWLRESGEMVLRCAFLSCVGFWSRDRGYTHLACLHIGNGVFSFCFLLWGEMFNLFEDKMEGEVGREGKYFEMSTSPALFSKFAVVPCSSLAPISSVQDLTPPSHLTECICNEKNIPSTS